MTLDMSRQASGQPATSVPPELPTVGIVGTALAITDYEKTMNWMDDIVECRQRACLTAAAVHLVMVAEEDPDTRAAVSQALAVPDGQPLVWAMRALGHHDASRVYGPELMDRYCARSAGTGVKMFLYGGRNQGALVELALQLRRRHPGLKIVGGYSPPYRSPTHAERDWIKAEINRAAADVVWVGTGQPKQEKWMASMRDDLEAPLLVGIGAAFDFHAGLVPQAPGWMQALGMEWLFRLAHEPRRLWRRYARYNPRFVYGFLRQYARRGRSRASVG